MENIPTASPIMRYTSFFYHAKRGSFAEHISNCSFSCVCNKEKRGMHLQYSVVFSSHSMEAKSNFENKMMQVSIHLELNCQARIYSVSSYQRLPSSS